MYVPFYSDVTMSLPLAATIGREDVRIGKIEFEIPILDGKG